MSTVFHSLRISQCNASNIHHFYLFKHLGKLTLFSAQQKCITFHPTYINKLYYSLFSLLFASFFFLIKGKQSFKSVHPKPYIPPSLKEWVSCFLTPPQIQSLGTAL